MPYITKHAANRLSEHHAADSSAEASDDVTLVTVVLCSLHHCLPQTVFMCRGWIRNVHPGVTFPSHPGVASTGNTHSHWTPEVGVGGFTVCPRPVRDER